MQKTPQDPSNKQCRHLLECQFYSVPEGIIQVKPPYMTPQWDEREHYCLVNPVIQRQLTNEFLKISQIIPDGQSQPLSLHGANGIEWGIEAANRAMRWVEKFGPPFPLLPGEIRKGVVAEVFDASMIIEGSYTLRTLTRMLDAWKQAKIDVLKKFIASDQLEKTELQNLEHEQLLKELSTDVLENRRLQSSKRDPMLNACWTCYDDYRWNRYSEKDGRQIRIRKDRLREHVLIDAQPGKIGRYTFLKFAINAISEEAEIKESNRKSFQTTKRRPYRLSKPQEKFCERFRQLKSRYEPKRPIFFKSSSGLFIPPLEWVALKPGFVSKRNWTENTDVALLEETERFLIEAANALLARITTEIFEVENIFQLRYRLASPWDAMVMFYVGKLTDRKTTSRICTVCQGDMSYKRSDAKTCSEACSKRLRRKR